VAASVRSGADTASISAEARPFITSRTFLVFECVLWAVAASVEHERRSGLDVVMGGVVGVRWRAVSAMLGRKLMKKQKCEAPQRDCPMARRDQGENGKANNPSFALWRHNVYIGL
jgi:hypothetical protein